MLLLPPLGLLEDGVIHYPDGFGFRWPLRQVLQQDQSGGYGWFAVERGLRVGVAITLVGRPLGPEQKEFGAVVGAPTGYKVTLFDHFRFEGGAEEPILSS